MERAGGAVRTSSNVVEYSGCGSPLTYSSSGTVRTSVFPGGTYPFFSDLPSTFASPVCTTKPSDRCTLYPL